MKRDDVVKEIEDMCKRLGIPEHLMNVRKVPSQVEAVIVIGAQPFKITAYSGIQPNDLMQRLAHVEYAWGEHKKGQFDIEEAIAMAEAS